MNLKSPLRRITAIAAGTLIGAAGALAFAAPASAHGDKIQGKADCVDDGSGNWTITWTLNAINASRPGTVIKLNVRPQGNLTETKGSALLKEGATLDEDQPLKGVQHLSKNDDEATIAGIVSWQPQSNDVGRHDAKTANVPTIPDQPFRDTVKRPKDCKPSTDSPSPSPSPSVSTSTPSTPATPSPSVTAPGNGGGGPTLPKTGPGSAAMVAGAGVLLAAGGGLFFLARRRRLKFTA